MNSAARMYIPLTRHRTLIVPFCNHTRNNINVALNGRYKHQEVLQEALIQSNTPYKRIQHIQIPSHILEKTKVLIKNK